MAEKAKSSSQLGPGELKPGAIRQDIFTAEEIVIALPRLERGQYQLDVRGTENPGFLLSRISKRWIQKSEIGVA